MVNRESQLKKSLIRTLLHHPTLPTLISNFKPHNSDFCRNSSYTQIKKGEVKVIYRWAVVGDREAGTAPSLVDGRGVSRSAA